MARKKSRSRSRQYKKVMKIINKIKTSKRKPSRRKSVRRKASKDYVSGAVYKLPNNKGKIFCDDSQIANPKTGRCLKISNPKAQKAWEYWQQHKGDIHEETWDTKDIKRQKSVFANSPGSRRPRQISKKGKCPGPPPKRHSNIRKVETGTLYKLPRCKNELWCTSMTIADPYNKDCISLTDKRAEKAHKYWNDHPFDSFDTYL